MPVSAVAIAAAPAQRTRQLALLAIALLWLLFWQRDTALSMVDAWYRSQTYNHGFVVLPIALWLIWRQRHQLAAVPIAPAAWPLPLLAFTGFAWLLGDLAGANALAQFALVTMLLLSIATVLGSAMTRALAFPLAFLFFMVPIGDFALPLLMDWTARFTVIALRLTGIPVYQEGLQFVIPSGNWSVVEACSGVRYLIASTCVGTLFAYLNFVSLRRRLLFIGVSILVPIVANWVRAYLIVLIGHLSGNQLAVGIDHLIYGWVFFGVVIMIMFAIGARWAEPPPKDPVADHDAGQRTAAARRPAAIVLAAAALVAAPAIARLAIAQPLSGEPMQIREIEAVPGWTQSDAPAPWTPAFEKADATVTRVFTRGTDAVTLHLVYYRNQDRQHKLVSSTNVLVRSDDRQWARVASAAQRFEYEGTPTVVRRSLLRESAGRRLVVWHWYSINGRFTASDHRAKLQTAIDLLRGHGDDSAGVFVYADPERGDADALIASFLRDAAVPLGSALHRTRSAGVTAP
jgi:exosortase A